MLYDVKVTCAVSVFLVNYFCLCLFMRYVLSVCSYACTRTSSIQNLPKIGGMMLAV